MTMVVVVMTTMVVAMFVMAIMVVMTAMVVAMFVMAITMTEMEAGMKLQPLREPFNGPFNW